MNLFLENMKLTIQGHLNSFTVMITKSIYNFHNAGHDTCKVDYSICVAHIDHDNFVLRLSEQMGFEMLFKGMYRTKRYRMKRYKCSIQKQ